MTKKFNARGKLVEVQLDKGEQLYLMKYNNKRLKDGKASNNRG